MSSRRAVLGVLTTAILALSVAATASALDVVGIWSTGLTDVRVTQTSPGVYTGKTVFGLGKDAAAISGCKLGPGVTVWQIKGPGPVYTGTSFVADISGGPGSCKEGADAVSFTVYAGGEGTPIDAGADPSDPGTFLRICRGNPGSIATEPLGIPEAGFPGPDNCSDEQRTATPADLAKSHKASDYITKIHRSACPSAAHRKGKTLTYFTHVANVPVDPPIKFSAKVNGHTVKTEAEDIGDSTLPRADDFNALSKTFGSITFVAIVKTASGKTYTVTKHFHC